MSDQTTPGTLAIWLEATRPKTLPAAIAPVLLGSAMAYHVGALSLVPASICLAFALLVQIGTNFANDYLDGVKGTDTAARLGPRRAVASGWVTASVMRNAALGILAFAFCLGLSLITFGGWWLLAVGIASVLCAWAYTGGPYPLAYNGLGDVFVVLFFGFIAVGCTFYVQVGQLSLDVLILGLACGLVVNNILIVNNYRDVDEDRIAGKRTLVVKLGRAWARAQYAASLIFAGMALIWLVLRGYSVGVLLGWVPLIVGLVLQRKLSRLQGFDEFLGALKGAALVVVAYSLIVACAIFIAGI